MYKCIHIIRLYMYTYTNNVQLGLPSYLTDEDDILGSSPQDAHIM